MAWLEQCEVCGGGGFFCCHRNNPDLNRAAGAGCPHEGGGGPGLVQEFQFFGRPGGGNLAWLLGEAGDGEDRTPQPPVAPALWDADGRWPALDGGCSISASSKPPPLAEAAVAGPATAAGATVPFFGCADAPNADAMEADKAASSGKDDSSGSVMDREARVLRYREKKKRRKFGKQIRYASRKAYAEARPRIRGRFVKAPEAEGTMMTPPPPLQLPLPLPPQAYDAGQVDVGWLRAFRP